MCFVSLSYWPVHSSLTPRRYGRAGPCTRTPSLPEILQPAMEASDHEAALREYGAARDLVPAHVEMAYWTAIALVNMGRVDESLPMFREIFAEDENWATLTPRLPASGLLPDDDAVIARILNERP